AMIAREDAKAAGVVRNRLMKAELRRKISDRFFNRAAFAFFPVGVLACEILFEGPVDLGQIAPKRVVVSHLDQSRLPRELEHADRVMIRPIPELRIEMAEKGARRWLPRPPKIENHFP